MVYVLWVVFCDKAADLVHFSRKISKGLKLGVGRIPEKGYEVLRDNGFDVSKTDLLAYLVIDVESSESDVKELGGLFKEAGGGGRLLEGQATPGARDRPGGAGLYRAHPHRWSLGSAL